MRNEESNNIMAGFNDTIDSTDVPERYLNGGAIVGIVIAVLIVVASICRYTSFDLRAHWIRIWAPHQSCAIVNAETQDVNSETGVPSSGEMTADTGPSTSTSAGIPPQDASADGASSSPKSSKHVDLGILETELNELAHKLGNHTNLQQLALKLGFSYTTWMQYKASNTRRDGRICTEGTSEMLMDWKKKTKQASQKSLLNEALKTNGFAEFADYEPGSPSSLNEIEDTTCDLPTDSEPGSPSSLNEMEDTTCDSSTVVLVTDASGFISSHIIHQLTQRGYQVRGTLDFKKGILGSDNVTFEQLATVGMIKTLFPKLDLCYEAGIRHFLGWMKAVRGCTYVIHTTRVQDNRPATEDDITKLLKVCQQAGGIKRVVLTGGSDLISEEKLRNNEWKGVNRAVTDAIYKYVSEKAALRFMRCQAEKLTFRLSIIKPPVVLGPILCELAEANVEIIRRRMNTRSGWFDIIIPICDVHDVAKAHIMAMNVKDAEDIHVSHSIVPKQVSLTEMADILKSEFKDQGYSFSSQTLRWDSMARCLSDLYGNIARGVEQMDLDTKKSVIDMAYSCIERGFIPKMPGYRPREQGQSNREETTAEVSGAMPPKGKKSERMAAASSDVHAPDHCDLIGEEVKDYFRSHEFRDLFQASLTDAIMKQMTELRDKLEKAEGNILELDNDVREKAAIIDHLQEKQSRIIGDIRALNRGLNDAEQYSRRNCVRRFGIPKQSQKNTDALTLHLAINGLLLNLKADDIDRSHRVGLPHQPTTGKDKKSLPPRRIIVKFTSYRARNLMIRNRKLLKGKRKGIEEDLTAANQLLLKEAKYEVELNNRLNAAWSSNGRIIVLATATSGKTTRKIIHSVSELANL